MWFAFVLCKTDIYNNLNCLNLYHLFVVICFRSLQNWYLQQLILIFVSVWWCCDLLSFFAKLIFTTTQKQHSKNVCQLWFAFVLCKTDIYNNKRTFTINASGVVICFRSLQNWYLQQRINALGSTYCVVICFRSLQNWYLQQPQESELVRLLSCDLLSFFAKLIFTTT